jgi:DNA ligase (NAD+)
LFALFLIGNNLPFQTQYEGLEAARAWGFKVPKEAKLAKTNRSFEFIEYWDVHRHERPMKRMVWL